MRSITVFTGLFVFRIGAAASWTTGQLCSEPASSRSIERARLQF
jgi:hypothetical protein